MKKYIFDEKLFFEIIFSNDTNVFLIKALRYSLAQNSYKVIIITKDISTQQKSGIVTPFPHDDLFLLLH